MIVSEDQIPFKQSFHLSFQSIAQNYNQTTLLQIPLNFQYQPIQLLTKQLTKLNNNYPYRMLYLGPRWLNSIMLHKKYSHNQQNQYISNPLIYEHNIIQKYQINLKKFINTLSFNENFHKKQTNNNAIYYRAFEGMNPTLKNQDQQLIFDSMFECGNLDVAIKVNQKQYDLFLRVDSNTKGHTLWYFFSIKNRKLKKKIKINICNLTKLKNLYEKDMKPYVFSKKKYQLYKTKWKQDAHHIQFSQKKLRYSFLYQKLNIRRLSQLSFQYNFQYQDDQVFFAYCIPFSYSCLLYQIQHLNKYDKFNNQILQIDELGKTLMGLSIPLLKITNPKVAISKKKIVVCTGRIHPGESNGSIMIHGLIKYLCSEEGSQLRNQSLFIIIPMMNPDGVIMGNYRTGVIGRDLNRLYLSKNKKLYPQIILVKDLVKNIFKQKEIYMFLDFHGHSEKKNTFLYGPSYNITQPEYYKSKVLARMLSKSTQMFRFYSCIFKISQNKKSTARAVMFQQFHIPYTYTIQSSNGFYLLNNSNVDYNKARWLQMGNIFGITINEFFQMISQYEKFISQRKQLVIKRKSNKQKNQMNKKSNLSTQNEIMKQQVPAKIASLLNMIEQIRKQQKQKKFQDSEKDSDQDNPQDQFKQQQQEQFNEILFNLSYEPQSNEIIKETNENKMLRKSSEYMKNQIQFLESYQKKPKSAYQRKRIYSSYKPKLKISKTIDIQQQSSSQNILNNTEQLSKYQFYQQSMDVAFTSALNQISKTQCSNKIQIGKKKVQRKNAQAKIDRKSLNPNVVLSNQSIFDNFSTDHNPNQIFTVPVYKQKRNSHRKDIKSRSNQSYENSNTILSRKNESTSEKILFLEQYHRPFEFNFTKILKNDNQDLLQNLKMEKKQKRIYPSAFYRIKQQFSGRKKQQVYKYEYEQKNLSLHIKKLS